MSLRAELGRGGGFREPVPQEAGPAAPVPHYRISCIARLPAVRDCCSGGLSRLIALWVRELGSGNCFGTSAWFLSAYLLGRSLVACSLALAASGPLWPGMAALLLATQFVPGIGAPWAVFCPWVEWPPQAIMGLARSSMLRTRRWGWDAWMRFSGSVGGLAGSWVWGLLAQAGRTCPTRCPFAAGWLGWPFCSVIFRQLPRSHNAVVLRGSLPAAMFCRHLIKPKPPLQTRLNGLVNYSLPLKAPCAAARKRLALLARRVAGEQPWQNRTACKRLPLTTVENKPLSGFKWFSGSWTRSW